MTAFELYNFKYALAGETISLDPSPVELRDVDAATAAGNPIFGALLATLGTDSVERVILSLGVRHEGSLLRVSNTRRRSLLLVSDKRETNPKLCNLDALLSLNYDVPTCFYAALTVYPAHALRVTKDAVLCALDHVLQAAGGDRVVVKLSDVSVTPLWITSGMTTPDGHALLRFVIPP